MKTLRSFETPITSTLPDLQHGVLTTIQRLRTWSSPQAPRLVDAVRMRTSQCCVWFLCFCFRQFTTMLCTVLHLRSRACKHFTSLLMGSRFTRRTCFWLKRRLATWSSVWNTVVRRRSTSQNTWLLKVGWFYNCVTVRYLWQRWIELIRPLCENYISVMRVLISRSVALKSWWMKPHNEVGLSDVYLMHCQT
jgi:hypothetical protein